ncbi:helix-turn-helix domain-containing protein [Algoriphagus algorifonticola]|uniref:helix-turn-helix domain-containing protein n=1 Tax=Algoriphagus algorifonticola TaxID=2593007 RepID=UPI0011A44E0D|nr:helix-turn-helix transcriptional regulator [Algoriphagus algorifonticola]
MAVANKQHIGKKIERIRILKGIKQETVAAELGVTQGAISRMEQSEDIDDEKLNRIAEVLGVSTELIRNFNEEAAVNIISNAFHDNSTLNGLLFNPSFNPVDKLIELFEENKNLYERMLETERSKIKLLEDQLKSLKK